MIRIPIFILARKVSDAQRYALANNLHQEEWRVILPDSYLDGFIKEKMAIVIRVGNVGWNSESEFKAVLTKLKSAGFLIVDAATDGF